LGIKENDKIDIKGRRESKVADDHKIEKQVSGR
jgi:hypothetical protein